MVCCMEKLTQLLEYVFYIALFGAIAYFGATTFY